MSAFHQSPAWQALRIAAKRRDGWRCVICGGRVGLEVDHIIRREVRPDLALALGNLQTLDRKCHLDKTRAELDRAVSPERKAWLAAVSALSSPMR